MSATSSGDFYEGLPEEISTTLKVATTAVSESFVQRCLDDPLFEISLLVMTFMAPDSTWRDGEPWGARHWTGKQGTVRSEDAPRGLPLSQFAAARPASADWNCAWWAVALKPDRTGLVARILTEAVSDPLVPIMDGSWATKMIADFDRDLRSRG